MPKRQQAAATTHPDTDRWRKLTWDELEAWAGVRSVERGRTYQRGGRVRDLARSEDGALLAWVQGTYRYATRVKLVADKIDGICTCPVGTNCKHAVAVVVDYLDALKNGRDVPLAGKSDKRWRLLEEGSEADEYEDEGEDACEEEGFDEPAPPARHNRSRTRRSSRQAAPADVRAYVEGLPAADLAAYVTQLAERNPEIKRDLKERAMLSRGEAGELIREARKEIRRLTAQQVWVNSWTGEGNLPDYSHLQQLFERLRDMGQADAVLELGETLLEAGMEQVGSSDDEGETATAIGNCLDIVFRSVPNSTRPDDQKLLYLIEASLRDDYDVCAGAGEVLEQDWPKSAWSAVADELAHRLEETQKPRGDEFHTRYARSRLVSWISDALRKSGRRAEIIPLLQAEAPRTGDYPELVDALLHEKRPEEARRWALEGIQQTQTKWPGIASQLRERVRKMEERQQNWPAVAAMRAEDFFNYPGIESLHQLEKAAEHAGCQAEVRAAALHFLETGQRPIAAPPAAAVSRTVKRGRREAAPSGGSTASPWPLPAVPPQLRISEEQPRFRRQGPYFDVLLQRALVEKRPDDVLRWYDRLRKEYQSRRYGNATGQEREVADAVVATHPERAAAIYRDLIGALIARTSPAAYQEALPYLRKLRATLQRMGREAEWIAYLRRLRETERRKRKLMEVLDRLDDRPIVER